MDASEVIDYLATGVGVACEARLGGMAAVFELLKTTTTTTTDY